ncbi:uncharacterized protein LOC129722861 [Wyeomyia smithii]|uniref:uncharacterized protein LOC129722861 n=1 Tax=Wyeomyia smithii TaxID=174621 RepID=UPI002467BE96|nr:uncharacterized protein LOC129722861 [Wyeomyia smithii]
MSAAIDSDTALHLLVRQTLVENRSHEEVATAVRCSSAANGMQNESRLTPAELALSLEPEGVLAKVMLQTEFENSLLIESFKAVMIRGNLRLLQILMKLKRPEFGEAAVLTALEDAYAELRTRNVALSTEVIDGVQYLLVESDYKCFGSAKINKEEKTDRVTHLVKCIDFLEENFTSSDYNDIDGRFVLYVRQILEHVFFLKNHLDGIPLIELQFCLAIFLRTTTGEANESHDLYGFMVDREIILNSLKLLKAALNDSLTCKEIDGETLFNCLKCKQYPQNSLRLPRRVLQGIQTDKQFSTFDNVAEYELLGQTQKDLLNQYCQQLHKQRVARKHRKKFKTLLKTYYTTKQFYSIHKIIRSIEIIKDLNLDDSSTQFITIAALKRSLQVIGEAIKSTKQTPNITKKLDSILAIFSSQSFVEMTKNLRQFFSHNYSLVKQRLDHDCPVDLFRSIHKNLQLSTNWLAYVKFLQYVYVFKRYLGKIYRMDSIQQMRSYVKFIGTEFKAKLQTVYEPLDLTEAIRLMQYLIDKSNDPKEIQTLKVTNLTIVVARNAIINDVFLVAQLIDEFFFLELYIKQEEATITRVHTIVKHMLDASRRQQRHETVDKSSIRTAPNTILQMRLKEVDPHKRMMLDEIWQRLMKQNISAIESLDKQTTTSNAYATDETRRTLVALGMKIDDDEFVEMVSRRLNNKYYHNLFCLANKYQVMSEVIKDRRVKESVGQLKLNLECMEAKDEVHFQALFDHMVDNIKNILLRYGDRESVAACQLSTIDNSALEFYLLQVSEILCSVGIFKLNIDSLKSIVPVVTGRNLRNYLAHDQLAYDVLTDACSTVKLNATYFAQKKIFHLYQHSRALKQRKTKPFINSFQSKVSWFNVQHEFSIALEACDIVSIENLALQDATSIHGRTFLSSDPISLVLNAKPAELIDQLLHPSTEANIFRLLLKISTNFVLKQQIHHLLAEPHRFCYNAAIRFELVDQITMLKTRPDISGQLTGQQVELILSEYSTESFRRMLMEHPLEWLSQRTRLQNTLLHWAVLRGDILMVEHLLIHKYESINKLNVFRETPLGLAVRYGYFSIARLLVDSGADINFGMWSPVRIASCLGDIELLPLLVNDQTNRFSVFNNPLMGAVENNHFLLFKQLYETFHFSLKVDQLLHKIILLDRKDFFHYILQSNDAEAIIHLVNSVDFTPLMTAATRGRREMCRQLLQKGANPCYKSPIKYTALHCAAFSGDRDLVSDLLQQPGVDIDAAADDNLTPIGIAIGQNNMNMISFLLAMKAKVTAQEFLQAGISHHYHIVPFLMDRDDSLINATFDVARRNLLMYAIIDREMSTVEYLISKGIDLNARVIGEVTALHIAASKNDSTVCDLLIVSGAELDAMDSEGRTALVVALEQEYIPVVEVLLKHGANSELVRSFRYRASNSASLLHKFAHENRIGMVRLLLDQFHFDVSLVDCNGETALDYATKQNNGAIVAILNAAGL